MIPRVITVLPEMPVNENGKVNRQALTKMAISRKARGSIRQPTAKAERQMQTIWAQVLDIEPEAIGLDGSFFELSGNSITAMKVVGEARDVGIRLAVADIFRQDRFEVLSELAGRQHFDASNRRNSQRLS